MHRLLAQIAPQRSTQYASLAEALAPAELKLSATARCLTDIEAVTLGGQRYLRCTVTAPIGATEREALATLACTSAYFDCVDSFGDEAGPWLRPIETQVVPVWPDELVSARRYKGKTNELFTRFLCNIARHTSAYANTPWRELRVLDPLAGGGTTLFVALALGAHAFGVEKIAEDVTSSAAFFRQLCKEQAIACVEKEERLKGVGRRWRFDVNGQTLVYANGDAANAEKLLNGFKRPHLIVTDLPYGIQHNGPLIDLLANSLSAWERWLEPGGALAFAWDATRFPREEMIAVLNSHSRLRVRNDSPYNALEHTVDRVIKRRDVIVATTPSSA